MEMWVLGPLYLRRALVLAASMRFSLADVLLAAHQMPVGEIVITRTGRTRGLVTGLSTLAGHFCA